MPSSFEGWAESWGSSWGSVDPNAMRGSASFSITGSLQVASGQMVGSASFSIEATGELTSPASVGRRFKYFTKAYLKREHEVLVFNSEEEKDKFLDAEEQAKKAINRAARRKVIATKPKPEVVDIEAVSKEASRLDVKEDVLELYAQQDFDRIMLIRAYAMYVQDEEEIELLLTL
jgi:hypothetical protein